MSGLKPANTVPVVTIDGPSGAGKGTVAQRVAQALGFHLLDSGAIYRAGAVQAISLGADLDSETEVLAALGTLDTLFEPTDRGVRVWVDGRDVTDELRTEAVGNAASRIASIPTVRALLLDRQREFRQAPGLVADGRDMGTVVFPDAAIKVFLTASAEERASRRAKQLKEKDLHVSIESLRKEISERDERDASRAYAPLKPADDAHTIDSSHLSIDAVVELVLDRVEAWQQATVS